MPKQRNPFLFGNNSARAQSAQRRQQRVQNLERAHVNVTNVTNTYELKKPRKPINPMIPVNGPVGNPVTNKLLTVIFDWDTGTPQIYEILSDDSVQLLTTTGLPAGIGFAVYVQFTWNGGYWWISGYNEAQTAYAIYKSLDGLTWELSYEIFDELGVWHPVQDLNGRFWRTDYQQTSAFPNRTNNFWIYKSEDEGITWVQSFFFTETGLNAEIEDMTDLAGAAVHPTDGNIIAFLVAEGTNDEEYAGIIITTDGGESWIHYTIDRSLYGGDCTNTGAGGNLAWLDDGTLAFVVEGRDLTKPPFPDDESSDIVYFLTSTNPTSAGSWVSGEAFDIANFQSPPWRWGGGADPINGALQNSDDKLICTYGPGSNYWEGSAGSGSLVFWSEDRGSTWNVLETPWISWMHSNAWYSPRTNKVYVIAENSFGDDLVWLLTAEWGSTVFTPIHSFGTRFDLNCWYGICTAESNA